MLTLKAVYRLPLRATEGLVRSLITLLGVTLPVAAPATLSRRARALRAVPVRTPANPLPLVVDSTSLEVSGEGEWKVPWAEPPARGPKDDGSAAAILLSRPRHADWWRVALPSGAVGWWRADSTRALRSLAEQKGCSE